MEWCVCVCAFDGVLCVFLRNGVCVCLCASVIHGVVFMCGCVVVFMCGGVVVFMCGCDVVFMCVCVCMCVSDSSKLSPPDFEPIREP